MLTVISDTVLHAAVQLVAIAHMSALPVVPLLLWRTAQTGLTNFLACLQYAAAKLAR